MSDNRWRTKRGQRAAQAQQQGPRGVDIFRALDRTRITGEVHPDIACHHCGLAHPTRTCPEVQR